MYEIDSVRVGREGADQIVSRIASRFGLTVGDGYLTSGDRRIDFSYTPDGNSGTLSISASSPELCSEVYRFFGEELHLW